MSVPKPEDRHIVLPNGKAFYFLSPEQYPYTIRQIARALSQLCRFSGNLSTFYSVAQHSVLCSRIVPKEYALEALLHDASEAFLSDIPAPLKSLLPEYCKIEDKVQESIFRHFKVARKGCVGATLNPAVEDADALMLSAEARDFELPIPVRDYDGLIGVPRIIPWTPEAAMATFLRTFNKLK
jgi:hypothetical protein